MNTTTRTTRRNDHEHECRLALSALRLTTANDTPALNDALRALNDLHHGPRDVRRTDQPTNRELHRRTIDATIDHMRSRADSLVLEATDPDAITICHHIERAINRIGYR